MKISFACTDCGKQTAALEEHVGRRFRCKACGSIQTVPTAEEAAVESGVVEEPDEPPRRRPKSRTGTTADAPSRRRPARAIADDDDDYEERPRRRAARAYDDEDEDADERPRRGKKRSRKKEESSSSAMLFGLIIGGVLLLGGGGFGLYYAFSDSDSDKGDRKARNDGGGGGGGQQAGPVRDVNFIPTDAPILVSVGVGDLWDSHWGRQGRAQIPQAINAQLNQGLLGIEQMTGLKITNVERATLVFKRGQRGGEPDVVGAVIRTSKSYDPSGLQTTLKNQIPGVSLADYQGKSYLRIPSGPSKFAGIQLASPNVVFGVADAKDLHVLADAARRQGSHAAAMNEIVGAKHHVAIALDGNVLREAVAQGNANAPDAPVNVDVKSVQHALILIDVHKDVTIHARVRCTDASAAKAQVDELNKLKGTLGAFKFLATQQFGDDPEAKRLINEAFAVVEQAPIEQSGDTVSIKLTLNFNLLNRAINFAKKQAQMP